MLLYGDEAGIKAAIDAHRDGTSLEKNEPVLERLKGVGWGHAVLFTVRITDEKPSIRAILTGSTGPRAVTVGLTTLSGLELLASIESASPAATEELKKLLEERRGSPDSLAPVLGPGAAAILVDVAKKATITSQGERAADPDARRSRPARRADQGHRRAVPFGDVYKTLRLYQLLVPGN